MIELRLTRKRYDTIQTIGTLDVYKDNLFVCSFATLEQEWNNNQSSNSCIPKGSYIVEHYNSEKHPNSFIVRGTSPRTYILIHAGNYYNHTAGCVLIGLSHSDINKDGYLDVIHSSDAMNMLNEICKDEKIILLDIE